MGVVTAITLAMGAMFIGMTLIEIQILMIQREQWKKEGEIKGWTDGTEDTHQQRK